MFPSYFEFYNPVKILCGEHALENIPFELKRLGSGYPLLITSRTPERSGLAKATLSPLDAVIYDGVPRDSSFQTVADLALLYRQRNCDGIVAMGGGSVMDTAKGLRLLISQGADSLKPFLGSQQLPAGKHVPFIMVPTTAGTGSECTKVAVISDPQTAVKHEFLNEAILPDVAVIDPRSTKTLPLRMTASTGIDALVHAIEAYTCLQKNPLSDAYATAAVSLIGQYLIKTVNDGANDKFRTAMAAASMLAGIAFSNSMVGLVHAVGHACGTVSRVAHGDAMAVLLPTVMRYNLDSMALDFSKLLETYAGPEYYAEVQSSKRPEKMVEEVEGLLGYLHQKCGLPLNLRQVGVGKEDFPAIAKEAINDGAIIFNPKQAGIPEILKILENAY